MVWLLFSETKGIDQEKMSIKLGKIYGCGV